MKFALVAIALFTAGFAAATLHRAPAPDKSALPVLDQAELIGTTPDGARLYIFFDREAERVCYIANRDGATALSCGYYEFPTNGVLPK